MPRPRSSSKSAGQTAAWAAIIQIVLKLLKAFLSSRAKTSPAPIEKPASTKTVPTKPSSTKSAPAKTSSTKASTAPARKSAGESEIADLFASQTSDRIVTAEGVIVKILHDDTDTSDGSGQHQQFLVEVDDGAVTIKIAHNLKFGRVPVEEGDSIRFKGEYEYNDRGGCIHWTHHDPKNWREGGWIEHNGQRYE